MNEQKKTCGLRQGIADIRREVDGIDREIVSLLEERQAAARAIGGLKRRLGAPVMDQAREAEITMGLMSRGGKTLTSRHIQHIFREIFSAARSVQEETEVVYLGPEGTFSHLAAVSQFGSSALLRPARSLDEVFERVRRGGGNCYGVVPAENSTEGSIQRTLDLLNEYDIKIVGERFLKVSHSLLSREKDIRRVKRIFSHEMALAQCRLWLKEHLPAIPVEKTASTGSAAQRSSQEPGTAAVGNARAADSYGLHLLEEHIEDHPGNRTRFFIMGKEAIGPTGVDKTSILFSLKHSPGALHRALGNLARQSINLTRIESRPTRSRPWEYVFFVDMEGHRDDEAVSRALGDMEESCLFVKWLGSYPAGREGWD